MNIGAFTPEQARELWQWYMSQKSLPQEQTKYVKRHIVEEFRPRHVQVLLEEDLFAAVDTKDDPSEASALVLAKRGSRLINTGRRITVVNRFENISVDAGTYAKAEWIDGEWQLYAADCAAESTSVDSGSQGDIATP